MKCPGGRPGTVLWQDQFNGTGVGYAGLSCQNWVYALPPRVPRSPAASYFLPSNALSHTPDVSPHVIHMR
jgi:hypothetical protein